MTPTANDLTSSEPVMEFEHVTIKASDKTLLSNVSFQLHAGGKAALCGKSGAGKSTVLKALLGLHKPIQGRILYRGQALNPQTIQTLRHDAVYISQEPLLAAETVREALLLPFRFKAQRQQKPSEQQLIDVLACLQLPASLLAQATSRISGGEKQRVALARGLLMGKSLFLFDEITSALDSDSKQAVYAVCFQTRHTLLSVTHDPDWLARCDTILTLDQGCLTGIQHDHA